MNLEQRRQYQREYMRKWRRTHPRTASQNAHHNAYMRSWEKDNSERVQERRKTLYKQKTPEQRLRYRKTRNDKLRQLLWDVKVASGCVDCGYKENPVALQFDHLPQYEKKFSIGSRLASKGKEALLAEINKCEVRCANCHAVKTEQRRNHG